MTVSNDYFAGLFDGEGCVSVTLSKKGCMSLVVQIQMCSREPVFAIYEKFGGRFLDGKRTTPKGSKVYTWSSENAAAVDCLKVLSEKCLNKKDVCSAALAIAISMFENDRKQPLSLEEKIKRLECFNTIVVSNRRPGRDRVIPKERIDKFLAPKSFGGVKVKLSDGRVFDTMSAAARAIGVSCGAIWHGVNDGHAVNGFKVSRE